MIHNDNPDQTHAMRILIWNFGFSNMLFVHLPVYKHIQYSRI